MRYAHPQIIELPAAIVAVRGTVMKEMWPQVDALLEHTVSAYEADE